MTSSFYCHYCQQRILGFIDNGCTVCKKRKFQKHLRTIFYSKCLLGIKLPIEIIIMIAKKASQSNDCVKIYNINNDCYRLSIHSGIVSFVIKSN